VHAQVVVVMGVAGSGKSTTARRLARRLGWAWQEGDELHPAHNVAKMASGRPLTDADRREWLTAIATWIGERRAAGLPGIVTCSALKRSYRDRLRGPGVVFVHLAVSREVLAGRLARRRGHFMPQVLLADQLTQLEPPDPDEDAIVVDGEQQPDAVTEQILARLPFWRASSHR
jgi:gluconokinase